MIDIGGGGDALVLLILHVDVDLERRLRLGVLGLEQIVELGLADAVGCRAHVEHQVADVLLERRRRLADRVAHALDAAALQLVHLQALLVELPRELLVDLERVAVVDRVGGELLAAEARLDHQFALGPARKVAALDERDDEQELVSGGCRARVAARRVVHVLGRH